MAEAADGTTVHAAAAAAAAAAAMDVRAARSRWWEDGRGLRQKERKRN